MAIIIAGERSGVGKTTVTLSLLASLCRQNANLASKVQSFKVGPDYIDPMFHQYVTGLPCRNLDAVLTSENYIKKCFQRHISNAEYGLIEGVMGLFDGVGNEYQSNISNQSNNQLITDFGSTAHIARLLNIPVLLVIDCSRLSGSVAAIAHGYCKLDPRIKIAGLVLNRVGSERHLSLLQNSLKPLEIPILGVLRREDNITIPDRHLGLIPTGELSELDNIIDRLATLGDHCFDWPKLLPLLKSGTSNNISNNIYNSIYQNIHQKFTNIQTNIKIAVAKDQAFNFYYQDNLDILEQLGAKLIYWSPLKDHKLPENIQGMYFGGGFPEVFAEKLAENKEVIQQVKTAILSGIPTIAECGGLMYLCENIIDFDGKSWPMVGILPTSAQMDKKLTLGYRRAVILENTWLLNTGNNGNNNNYIYGHEFHRSHVINNCEKPLFNTYRYDNSENTGFEGWNLPNVHASYIHQHWGESLEIPQRFLETCR
ncbi:cobyrinate a,c-diamide synthase [Anabaena sp. FACHB-1237]|uniref:cobyrinate a,c-diamide synthase n=1 Tax=Anabaena sp. FACHB-1237 TaxID=2692769 RepID=UPI001680BBB8|nr:cobyrinate a,c-diamide synthase [Anabaena sp. FACHB-1237]MBD2138112.1 cobyrinate a,c-diamide synthase [Anabaena sp. FACHB-1237]